MKKNFLCALFVLFCGIVVEVNGVTDTLGTQIDQLLETHDNQIENLNRTLLEQANTYDTKFDKVNKELENVTQTLHKQANTYDTKFDKLTKELETLREQLSDFNGLFHSDILSSNQNYIEQIKTWLPFQWRLCYRATTDGWAATTFHSKCDNKGPTVTIVRVGSYVFGGYSDISWESSGGYKTTSKPFIFSLKNKDNLAPFIAPVYKKSQNAIVFSSGYGPTFGGGHDLHIANNANSNTNSYANLGNTYQPPPGYSPVTNNIQALLAGSYHFTPSEVEVFYLI